jgi:hypothetical protein
MRYFTPKIMKDLEKRRDEMLARDEEQIEIATAEELEARLLEGCESAEMETCA